VIERIDHVNIVVDDMQMMVAFYQNALGLRVGKRATIAGPWIGVVTGLAQVKADVVFLEAPTAPTIELIRYQNPDGLRPHGLGDPNTKGLRHIAFRANDIDAMVARLKHCGARMLSDVQQVPSTQVDYADQRKRLVYFLDPEGNLLELCAYEKQPSTA
jgi:catechol 2,3-dioxygenase-like lactoylglutathione lyase family enzyme